jgi:hypothetical protein
MNRLFALLALAAIATALLSQSTNVPPDLDKSGRTITPRPMPHVIYSPADLAHNAVTLPASGTTSTSAVVNMSAVTKSTLFVNCTQIVNVQVNTYKRRWSHHRRHLYRDSEPACGSAAGVHRFGIHSEWNGWNGLDEYPATAARVQFSGGEYDGFGGNLYGSAGGGVLRCVRNAVSFPGFCKAVIPSGASALFGRGERNPYQLDSVGVQ